MGSALADACIEAGAQVTLVHGNISVTLNQKAQIISVISAKEMYQSVAAKPIHTGFFVNLQTSCKISLVGVNSKISVFSDFLILFFQA
jgi:phosphopantothenoylcysteine synthetase/decarboxylase